MKKIYNRTSPQLQLSLIKKLDLKLTSNGFGKHLLKTKRKKLKQRLQNRSQHAARGQNTIMKKRTFVQKTLSRSQNLEKTQAAKPLAFSLQSCLAGTRITPPILPQKSSNV